MKPISYTINPCPTAVSRLIDFFVNVEGDAAWFGGVEAGAGFVYDSDNPGQSGAFGTVGPAVGLNFGIAVGGGFALRDVEGRSYNLDVNLPIGSVSILFDDNGFNGIGFGVGPGVGGSASYTNTETFTVDDFLEL